MGRSFPTCLSFSGRACPARPDGTSRTTTTIAPRRRGFATVTAIALIGLTAMAVVAITTELITDARRTQNAEIETQLRQLLLAGADEAARDLDAWAAAPADGKSGKEVRIPLPSTLAADGSLKLTRSPANAPKADRQTLEIRIDATWCGRRAAETLRYRRAGGGWTLDEVRPV
jgi:hypothetical protein